MIAGEKVASRKRRIFAASARPLSWGHWFDEAAEQHTRDLGAVWTQAATESSPIRRMWPVFRSSPDIAIVYSETSRPVLTCERERALRPPGVKISHVDQFFSPKVLSKHVLAGSTACF